MGVLSALKAYGFATAYHISPLTYLPSIIHAGRLLSKTSLLAAGLDVDHFRPSSRRRDIEQGFADYVHLMNRETFALREDKLKRGMPHVLFCVPIDAITDDGTLLCRYNIAKHRKGEKDRFKESPANGLFVSGLKVPVANDPGTARMMIAAAPKDRSLEVLVRVEVAIETASLVCFSGEEAEGCKQLLDFYKHPAELEVHTSSYRAQTPNHALEFVQEVAAGERGPREFPKLGFD